MMSSRTSPQQRFPSKFPWLPGNTAVVFFSIILTEYGAASSLFITFVPAANPHRQSKWDLIFQCFIRLSFSSPQGMYNEMTPCSAYTEG